MRRAKHGFTLIEAFITMFILFIAFGVLAGTCSYIGSNNNAGYVENEANTTLATLYPGAQFNVMCQHVDTDANGYVTCTAVRHGSDATPLSLQCAVRLSFNSGCQLTRMVVPSTNIQSNGN